MGSFSRNLARALSPLTLALTVVACVADLTEEAQLGAVAQADQCASDGGAAAAGVGGAAVPVLNPYLAGYCYPG